MAETIPYEDIADVDLRAQLQTLELTIPHAQSVIDPTIGSYDVNFYHKLLAMEAYTYERSEQFAEMNAGSGSGQAGVTEYQPYWQAFNAALMDYVTHTPMSKQKVKDVIAGLFGFMNVHYGHGKGSESTLVESNAKAIFVMDGFIETVLSRPLAYYDDYVPEDPMAMPEPTMASAEKLEGEPEVVGATWDADVAKVDRLLGLYADAISDVAVDAMFENTDPNAEGPTARTAWQAIFIDLNWKWYIEHFGSEVKIPPQPVPPPTIEE